MIAQLIIVNFKWNGQLSNYSSKTAKRCRTLIRPPVVKHKNDPSSEKVELFPCEQSEHASFVTEFLALFQMRRQNWFCTKHLLWFNPHAVGCVSKVAVLAVWEWAKVTPVGRRPALRWIYHHTVWQLRQECENTCRDQETHLCPRAVLFKRLIYSIAIVQLGSGSGEEQKSITTKNTHTIC